MGSKQHPRTQRFG